jgi:hypothetical protein
MVFLLVLMGLAFIGIVAIIVAGVAFYELVVVKRRKHKDNRDYTRSYDWTADQ